MLWQQWDGIQRTGFGQVEQDIHVLHRLTRRTFNQIVDD
jgi:hypothetical protein